MLRVDNISVSIHPPRVGRDNFPPGAGQEHGHFNPPSPCGEGPFRLKSTQKEGGISIHPPRVGRDGVGGFVHLSGPGISIHPPRVGRDFSRTTPAVSRKYFNPPSPCGEGPCALWLVSSSIRHFNPPSPCGEGQQKLTKILCKLLC